jgi:hypothetical protein
VRFERGEMIQKVNKGFLAFEIKSIMWRILDSIEASRFSRTPFLWRLPPSNQQISLQIIRRAVFRKKLGRGHDEQTIKE